MEGRGNGVVHYGDRPAAGVAVTTASVLSGGSSAQERATAASSLDADRRKLQQVNARGPARAGSSAPPASQPVDSSCAASWRQYDADQACFDANRNGGGRGVSERGAAVCQRNSATDLPAMSLAIRPIEPADREAWESLWAGYNAFYDRAGATALAREITDATWRRFLDRTEPMFALVAEHDGGLAGLAHCLFHRSTSRIEPVCYLPGPVHVSRRCAGAA